MTKAEARAAALKRFNEIMRMVRYSPKTIETYSDRHEAAILRLQRTMGHGDPKTTMIYLHLLKPKSDVLSPPDVPLRRAA